MGQILEGQLRETLPNQRALVKEIGKPCTNVCVWLDVSSVAHKDWAGPGAHDAPDREPSEPVEDIEQGKEMAAEYAKAYPKACRKFRARRR